MLRNHVQTGGTWVLRNLTQQACLGRGRCAETPDAQTQVIHTVVVAGAPYVGGKTCSKANLYHKARKTSSVVSSHSVR